MRHMILALVGALALTAGPAMADRGSRGDWELGIYGGYGWLDDYAGYHPKDHALFGGRLGYFFTPMVSLEVSGQQLPTHTENDTLGAPSVDFKINSARANLLLNFLPNSVFRPFITGGVGMEWTKVEGLDKSSSDFDWNAGGGFRWFITPKWNLRADGRYVQVKPDIVNDESQGNVEATLGLGVMFGGHSEAAAAVVTPPPANQAPTVTCAADRAEILPGETVRVVATATDPEGDPLTYDWNTSTGHVTGTGNTVTLDFTGASAPSSATVSVKVSDNHGNTTTCSSTVALSAPAKPAEAVSCLAGGFPRNLSRLTNVDKACLDDVVQRLKGDPQAHVVVIGYADPHERTPQRVAQQRADAIKDYMVSAGVDAARITTRSAGATNPAATGADAASMAQNRRVQVWFVPEGAKEPGQ